MTQPSEPKGTPSDHGTPPTSDDRSATGPRVSEPSGIPGFFWWIVIGSILSLGAGVTLLVLSQTGQLGAAGGTGPGHLSESYTEGQRVDIWRNESWHPGAVVSVDGSTYKVRYDRANVFGEESVDASRLRAGK